MVGGVGTQVRSSVGSKKGYVRSVIIGVTKGGRRVRRR